MSWAFFQLGSWVQDVKSPSPATARALHQARAQHLVETLVVAHLVNQIEAGDHVELVVPHAQLEDRAILAR